MSVDKRVTYRRAHSYNTRSNRVRKVTLPSGKIVVHYETKPAKGPRCGDTGVALQGIPRVRPTAYKRLEKHERRVSRPYGGVLCATAVRDRIMRAFIIEEQKIVKRVLAEKMQQAKAQNA